MRLLLDTHALLWFQTGDRRLSRAARAAIETDDAELLLSAASVWEMAIKASLGRLHLPSSVAAYLAEKIGAGYRVLASRGLTRPGLKNCPGTIVTRSTGCWRSGGHGRMLPRHTDRVFRKYGVDVIW